MKFIFCKNYRQAIAELFERAKEQDPSFTQQKLARAVKIQSSYLSSTLVGRVELNADQLFVIARYFGLSEAETDFLLLLRERDRAVVPERKKLLDARVREIRENHLRTKEHL